MFVYLFFDCLIVLSGCMWDWVFELNVVVLNLQVLGRVLEVEGCLSGIWGWIVDSNEDSGFQCLIVLQLLFGSIVFFLNVEEINKYLNQFNDYILCYYGQDDDFCKVVRFECNFDVEIVGMFCINFVDQEFFEYNCDLMDIMFGN